MQRGRQGAFRIDSFAAGVILDVAQHLFSTVFCGVISYWSYIVELPGAGQIGCNPEWQAHHWSVGTIVM